MRNKVLNMMEMPSGLSLGVTHTWLMTFLSVVAMYMTAVKTQSAFVAVYIVLDHTLLNWQTKVARQAMFVGLGITWLFSMTAAFPIWFEICVLYDQSRIRLEWLNSAMSTLINIIGEVDTSFTHPIVGTNMQGPNYIEIGLDYIKQLLNIGFETKAERIRSLDVSLAPLPMSEKPSVSAEEALGVYNDLSWKARWIVYLICALIGFLLQGVLSAMCIILIPLMPGLIEDSNKVEIRPENATATMQEGVYRIACSILNNTYSHGVGVVFDGVMHVPFHVCQAGEISYKNLKLKPYYINLEQDLVTYGGPPKFTRVEPDDQVYVNTETVESRTSYKLESLDTNSAYSTLAWKGVTKPGESGSPVLAFRKVGEETKLLLVGQAGRYIRTETGNVTEFSNTTGYDQSDDNQPKYKSIVIHPGAGKTRKSLPAEIQRILVAKPHGRILVSGPTRVVCKEMYEALKNDYSVGLNMHKSNHKNRNAKVQIAPHAVAVQMVTTGAYELSNLSAIIIDEAHFDDPCTIMLRDIGQYKMREGVELIEMSATLDGTIADGSNFTIIDNEMKTEDEARDVIASELENGKRVLVFLPGVESQRSRELQKCFREYDPVILSRSTFESGMKGVKNENQKLVLATDIAECGINVPDLDVVVDYGLKVGFEYDGGVVSHSVCPRDDASRVQRRGRVGREKPGTYYYIKRYGPKPSTTAAQHDARVLSTGRVWSNKGNEWNIQLTEKQFLQCLNANVNEVPLQVHISRDKNGLIYSKEKIRLRVLSARGGPVNITNCGVRQDCACIGRWKYYDERMHKWLCEM